MAPKRTPKVAAHAIPHESPLAPQVGDKVIPERSESTYIVSRVSPDGCEVDLSFPGTNIERFRVKTATLKFVDRVPQPTDLPPRVAPHSTRAKLPNVSRPSAREPSAAR